MRKYIPPHASLIPPQAKRVFTGIIYDVYHWEEKLFDGSSATFEMLKRPDTVKVIALCEDAIVITKQEQPHIGSFFDFPGGMHDNDSEDELQAAKRELVEETGLIFAEWKLLEVFQPNKKIDHFVYVFLAYGKREQKEPLLDAGERIEVVHMTLSELQQLMPRPEFRSPTMEVVLNANTVNVLTELPDAYQSNP